MSTYRRVAPILMTCSLAGFGLSACAGARVKEPPKTHILMANQRGTPVDPDGLKSMKPGEYDHYLDDLFADLGAYCAKHKPCQVLFFFHGGLNTPNASVQRAKDLEHQIQEAGYYPIFVNWDSSLPSSCGITPRTCTKDCGRAIDT